MRLTGLLVTAILAATPASAQQPPSSSGAAATSAQQDAAPLNLPVSLDKIRDALAQPVPPALLKSLDETPTFRIEIRERQKIDDLIKSLKFDSGPAVPGGLYGYEQQRQLFPSVDNPLAQPYAPFTSGELFQVSLTSLFERILAGRLVNAITSAERAHAVAAAKAEVNHAIAEYCAAQPNGGAGIQICAAAPAIR